MMTQNHEIKYVQILACLIEDVYEPVRLIARNRPENCCWCVLNAWDGVFAEFRGFLCMDHVRLHLCHPYI